MKHPLSSFALLFPLLALGCSDPSAAETSNERCIDPLPTRGTTLEGALTIGQGDASNFTGLEDGQQLVLIHGPQGGFMITPVLQVDSAKMGTDGRCVYVNLAASIDGLDSIGLQVHLSDLTPSGHTLTTEPIPFLLAFDPNLIAGKTCAVSATWEDDGVNATAQSTVVLVQ